MKFTKSIVLLISGCAFTAVFAAQSGTGDKQPPKPKYIYRKDHHPDGIGKFYMGREIAKVMGHRGAGWLDRPEREKEENPAKLMASLNLKPGMQVADIGAGSGYFSLRLAKKVGDRGKVYAVDIQKEMLAIIKAKTKKYDIDNIVPVLGAVTDPKLPPKSIDLALMVDVYHEFSHPYEMTVALLKALKKGGKLVFVEYRMEDPKVPIKLLHKMSKKQVAKEMSIHPVRHVRTIDTLPWQHVIIFEKK